MNVTLSCALSYTIIHQQGEGDMEHSERQQFTDYAVTEQFMKIESKQIH